MNGSILVAGAGGFVGGHLVEYLVQRGHSVRAVSSRPVSQWLRVNRDAENLQLDLRELSECRAAVRGVSWIYNLAAKVGGIGYIKAEKLACYLSVLINTNLLRAACDQSNLAGYLFCSSACVYGSSKSELSEYDPPVPSAGYGEEKIFSERVCQAFSEEYDIPMRIVRPTCIYGPGDDVKGSEGKDHVPAATIRKIIAAKKSGQPEILVWGDGNQTRDFLYVSDAVEGFYRFQQQSGLPGCDVLNMASSDPAISINDLISLVEDIAAFKTVRCYNLERAEGVRHRKLSTAKLWQTLRWVPPTSLKSGLDALYRDIWAKLQ